MRNTSLIVVGEMNIDIIVSGLPYFPGPGQLVNGGDLRLGAGGKSRNIAAMAGALMPQGAVAMVSKTAQDVYGLWSIPIKSLEAAGVNISHIKIIERENGRMPGFAVVLVDKDGNNQIIGAPGITREFNVEDIDAAEEAFRVAGGNHGFMAFIGNCPIATAKHAISKAANHGIRVVFDPGGADNTKALEALLNENIYFFKPNEHEAQALTGVKVTDFQSAREAAKKIRDRGVQNVLITAGSNGAYLFCRDIERSIPAPELELPATHDETGCGDQVMAALCAFMIAGESIETAAELAVLAGTLQFHKSGVQPVTASEVRKYISG